MDVMDIARLSTQMAHTNVMRDINISVMRNVMDHAEQTAELMTDLMQSTNVPPVGFDGLGAMLDVMV